VWWVRQAMQQVVSELSRPMVLSDRALRQLARIKDAQRRFEQAHRHEPSPSELASLVGLPRWQIESLFRAERNARGLDEPVVGESKEGTSLAELLADVPALDEYELVDQRELARTIPNLLTYLSERERTVIRSRYGLGRRVQPLRWVAPKLGVSDERVRQIQTDALEKMHAKESHRAPRRESSCERKWTTSAKASLCRWKQNEQPKRSPIQAASSFN